MRKLRDYNFVFILFFICACSQSDNMTRVVPENTVETKALYQNLIAISRQGFMFGHQEADAYGVTWVGEDGRSDVKDVCGSHPAVHGWDLGNENQSLNIDGVPFADMLRWIRETYERGGINTVSWHMDNPVTGNDAWNKTPVVADILPGGKGHAAYKIKLDLVAGFFSKCESGGIKIPIIFRPFHEHNGDWFWWGKGICTEEQFIKLWRFTYDYLKVEKKINHLLFCFSPDRSRINLANAKQSYLYGYPGDDYVDMLGLDNYMDVGVAWNTRPPVEQRANFVTILQRLTELAQEKSKPAALTETGLEGVTNPNWFTEILLNPIKENQDIHIAYALVWRNANETHHYAPYPGHSSAADFINFYADDITFFEDNLVDMYK